MNGNLALKSGGRGTVPGEGLEVGAGLHSFSRLFGLCKQMGTCSGPLLSFRSPFDCVCEGWLVYPFKRAI